MQTMTSKVDGSSLIIKQSGDMVSSYFQNTKRAQAGCSNTNMGRLGCGESPVESSGVHMEYQGDRKALKIKHNLFNSQPILMIKA